MNWKKISSKLVDDHANNGSAVITLDPHSEGVLVNLSHDEFCLAEKGKDLKVKSVRKFLWENRKKRALQRENAAIWSSYMPDEDKSYMGVGALTSEKVAKRMKEVTDAS